MLLHLRDFSGKDTGMGCHFLLQEIFPIWGSNPYLLRLLQCRRILYPLSHMESPNSIYCCCCCSVAKFCPTLCDPMDCSTPGFPVLTSSWSLLKLMSTESVMPSNHLIFCRPLLLFPSVFLSIKAFDCVDHNKLWKILREMGIADHLWGYWYLRLLTSWKQDCREKYQ